MVDGSKKGQMQNLQIFNKRVRRCMDNLIMFKRYLFNCRGDESFMYWDWHKSLMGELKEAVFLVSQYNYFEIEELIKVRDIFVEDNLINLKLEDVAVNLDNILREIQTAQDYLYAYLRPNLSELEKGKIDLLRKDFENLETEEKIKKNLEIALMEAESGHELACGLISARVVVERLEKIEGKIDEERLTKLVELKIINNTESSKFSSKAFLDAARAARNAVSHQIDWFPTGAECLSLLSSAFRMAEWVSKYINKIRENKNE